MEVMNQVIHISRRLRVLTSKAAQRPIVDAPYAAAFECIIEGVLEAKLAV
jgi:hypothetical protein